MIPAGLDAYLASTPGRCSAGFDRETQGPLCGCKEHDDAAWAIFRSAVLAVVRHDQTVHQSDVRPLVRGRIFHKKVGLMYRQAKRVGLLIDVDRRERSDDVVGRNTNKLDPVYLLGAVA